MKSLRLIALLTFLSPFVFASVDGARIPMPVSAPAPSVPESLVTKPGEVELLITLNRHGYVTGAEVKRSTNPKLDRPCLTAVRQWRYTAPGADAATFIQPFRFGGDTIDTTAVTATRPEPRHKVAPELPDSLKHISGEVMVAAAIDAGGAVSNTSVVKSSHEELNALCLEAAKQWTFKPATDNGHAIASNVYVPFHFIGKPGAVTAEVAKAELVDNAELVPLRQPSPVVPEDLANVDADASLTITVDNHGYVVDATVLSSTNAELAELARRAVLQWKFRPVVKGGVAVAAKAVQPVKFGGGYVSVAQVDKLPSVRTAVNPTLPKELDGVSGFARVGFDIDASGHVVSVNIAESSHEAFSAAILAVAKDWTFKPALRAGVATGAHVTVPFVFGSKFSAN